jgi:hypothetical protein
MNTREGGFSTVDIVASITVLVLGLMSMAVGFCNASRLASTTHDNYLLSQAHRGFVADLQSAQFANLPTEYGPSSGKDNFWLKVVDTVTRTAGEILYAAPVDPYVEGKVQLFPDESTPPSGWRGITGGLDLDADGTANGSSASDYRVLPTSIEITVQALDGPRTLQSDLIITGTR